MAMIYPGEPGYKEARAKALSSAGVTNNSSSSNSVGSGGGGGSVASPPSPISPSQPSNEPIFINGRWVQRDLAQKELGVNIPSDAQNVRIENGQLVYEVTSKGITEQQKFQQTREQMGTGIPYKTPQNIIQKPTQPIPEYFKTNEQKRQDLTSKYFKTEQQKFQETREATGGGTPWKYQPGLLPSTSAMPVPQKPQPLVSYTNKRDTPEKEKGWISKNWKDVALTAGFALAALTPIPGDETLIGMLGGVRIAKFVSTGLKIGKNIAGSEAFQRVEYPVVKTGIQTITLTKEEKEFKKKNPEISTQDIILGRQIEVSSGNWYNKMPYIGGVQEIDVAGAFFTRKEDIKKGIKTELKAKGVSEQEAKMRANLAYNIIQSERKAKILPGIVNEISGNLAGLQMFKLIKPVGSIIKKGGIEGLKIGLKVGGLGSLGESIPSTSLSGFETGKQKPTTTTYGTNILIGGVSSAGVMSGIMYGATKPSPFIKTTSNIMGQAADFPSELIGDISTDILGKSRIGKSWIFGGIPVENNIFLQERKEDFVVVKPTERNIIKNVFGMNQQIKGKQQQPTSKFNPLELTPSTVKTNINFNIFQKTPSTIHEFIPVEIPPFIQEGIIPIVPIPEKPIIPEKEDIPVYVPGDVNTLINIPMTIPNRWALPPIIPLTFPGSGEGRQTGTKKKGFFNEVEYGQAIMKEIGFGMFAPKVKKKSLTKTEKKEVKKQMKGFKTIKNPLSVFGFR